MLAAVIDHAREDISKISPAKAQALFEKTANVLSSPGKEYEDYAKQGEAEWEKVS